MAITDNINIYMQNDPFPFHRKNFLSHKMRPVEFNNQGNIYYGEWNTVLKWLIVNRPFAHIGILVSNGCDRPAYRDAQIEIAAKYGIPYIDMNGDRFTPVMISSMNHGISEEVKQIVKFKQAVDYPSNTHPNDRAHEFESVFIESFLRSI